MRRLFLVLAVVGCAKAGPETGGMIGETTDGGMPLRPDSGGTVFVPDAAPLPDAPVGQQTVTLSQTTDTTVSPSEIGCYYADPLFGFPLATDENHWYRVFHLADYGINGAFSLQRVTFYTDWASAGTGTTQPATIKVGTYGGTLEANTLDTAQITAITSKDITIPNADSTQGQPPPVVTDMTAMIPAGSNLIVEVTAPDGVATDNLFFIGVSDGGESKKGYIRSPGCTAITTATSIVGGLQLNKSVLITVTGTY